MLRAATKIGDIDVQVIWPLCNFPIRTSQIQIKLTIRDVYQNQNQFILQNLHVDVSLKDPRLKLTRIRKKST